MQENPYAPPSANLKRKKGVSMTMWQKLSWLIFKQLSG